MARHRFREEYMITPTVIISEPTIPYPWPRSPVGFNEVYWG